MGTHNSLSPKEMMKLVLFIIVTAYGNTGPSCIGVADNWELYSRNGIMIEVDISPCNITEVDFVDTHVSCKTSCWTLGGVTSIYKMSNQSFTVFIRHNLKNWSLNRTRRAEFKLHYIAYGQHDDNFTVDEI